MTAQPMARVTAAEHREQVAAAMTEKAFQSQVEQVARSLGWLVYHPHDSRRSEPGFPDLVLVHPAKGRLMFRELKTQRGRVRAEQTVWLAALAAAGQDAAVWRPADLIDRHILKELR